MAQAINNKDVSDVKDKKRILDSMKNSLKKKWGAEVIRDAVAEKVASITSGSPILDAALTGAGYPEGRFVEIYGDESSGKTTLVTLALKAAQDKYPDKIVGFIDVEHAFNVPYANALGLNTSEERFMFAQPNSAEEALEILEAFCNTGMFSAIGFDSIGGLVTQQQLDKGIDEETMGSLAKVLSKSASRLHTAANDTGTLVLWINQTRNKIVMMGNPETVSGGKTLPFFHSVRLRIRRTNIVMDKGIPIGQEVEIKVIKNKVGNPFGVINTSLFFGIGFDKYRETVEVALENGTLFGSGAWTYWKKGTPDEIKWNGKAMCIQYMRDNLDDFNELYSATMGTHQTKIDINIANETDETTGLTNAEVQNVE